MPGKPNKHKPVTVTITTTPMVAEMLDWLADRGTFGRTRAEAAERIVSERLREFLPDEKFKPQGDKK